MRKLFTLGCLGLFVASLADCARTAPVPQIAYWVSSDASQYSPVASLRIRSARDGSRLRIAIDTGVISVPGEYVSPAPLAITDLYLTAYVATRNVGPLALALPDSLRFPDRRGWRAVATGDSIPLAPDIRYGERRSVERLLFTVTLPSGTEQSDWLVFRISGKVVDHRLRFDPRGALQVGPLGEMTRVYACSDRDLTGQVDTARSNGLRRAYGLLC